MFYINLTRLVGFNEDERMVYTIQLTRRIYKASKFSEEYGLRYYYTHFTEYEDEIDEPGETVTMLVSW